MNCHEFQEREPDLDHLGECPECAARNARHQQVRAGLRALAAGTRHTEAPSRVERRLLAAFRAQSGLAAVAPRAAWMPLAGWAAALAATVLAGVLLIQSRQPQRTHRVTRSAVELAVVENLETVDPIASLADEYGDFIPLPNAESIVPNEQLNVVRLAVPRSAMIPLGFAVSEENASETVEADVVLGANGVARAVRFLDDGTGF
jgi:anti-sigma factor RsiW